MASTDTIRGRQTATRTLTNKSGGAVAIGDVVVIGDAATDNAFTTTTNASFNSRMVGVAMEAIASNAAGLVAISGYVPIVNSAVGGLTREHFLFTSTVAKEATGSATRAAGAFGQVLETGVDPEAIIWGMPDAAAASGVATDAIWDAAGDTVVGSGANTAVKRKNNDGAAVAPAVTDDSGDGYAIGSRWLDTTADKEYVATDVTVGAAVWKETTAAGAGATIAYPSLKPGTPSDDFGAALSGWTAVSIAGTFVIGQCHAQAIDGSHLLMGYYAQSGFIYSSASNVDQEWIVGGLVTGLRIEDQFVGIALLDTSNNGVGLIYHKGDNTMAIIAIAAGVYTAPPAAIVVGNAAGLGPGLAIGTPTKIWMRLTRVGNTWDAYFSFTGSAWDVHAPSTMSSTITVARKAIGVFNTTGQNQISADWLHTV